MPTAPRRPQAHRKRQQLQARRYRPSVLVIDQLGYLPVDRESAHWLLEVVTRRYEKGSIILMSNPSRSWRRGFGASIRSSGQREELPASSVDQDFAEPGRS